MKRLLLLALATAPGTAFASCNTFTIDPLPNTSYSFNTGASPSLAFSIKRKGGNGCSYFVTADYGSASSFPARALRHGGNALPMNLYLNATHTSVWKDLPDATSSSEAFTGSMSGGTKTAAFTYYPQLGAVAYERYGGYSETFTLKLYDGTPSGTHSLRDSKTVTFHYTMARKIDLSLVPTGAAFNAGSTAQSLAFGTLAAGVSRACDLVLRYNAGYRVRVSSANQGKLKHASLADTVPYTFRLNGAAVSLAGSDLNPVTAATGTGVSPPAGLALPVSVTIGSLGSARAGSYSDVITVTVATTE
jgi:spore coat protein U-like protein